MISVDDICGYCAMCAKPLFPRRRHARTCSNRCRQRLWRRRHGVQHYPLPLTRIGTDEPDVGEKHGRLKVQPTGGH
jgi:hypothetical protein